VKKTESEEPAFSDSNFAVAQDRLYVINSNKYSRAGFDQTSDPIVNIYQLPILEKIAMFIIPYNGGNIKVTEEYIVISDNKIVYFYNVNTYQLVKTLEFDDYVRLVAE